MKHATRQFSLFVIASAMLIAGLLSACSARDPTQAQAAATTEGVAPAVDIAVADPAHAEADLSDTDGVAADRSTPVDKYQPLANGTQIFYAYMALSGEKPDYEPIAIHLYSLYKDEQDQFKRRDLLEAATQVIDEEIQKAKGSRYFVMKTPTALGPYDFASKSFPINAITEDGMSFSFSGPASSYSLAFNNAAAYSAVVVEDENTARALEEIRATTGGLYTMKLYFFAAGVQSGTRVLRVEITKVEMLDDKGRIIITI